MTAQTIAINNAPRNIKFTEECTINPDTKRPSWKVFANGFLIATVYQTMWFDWLIESPYRVERGQKLSHNGFSWEWEGFSTADQAIATAIGAYLNKTESRVSF